MCLSVRLRVWLMHINPAQVNRLVRCFCLSRCRIRPPLLHFDIFKRAIQLPSLSGHIPFRANGFPVCEHGAPSCHLSLCDRIRCSCVYADLLQSLWPLVHHVDHVAHTSNVWILAGHR